MSLPLPAIDRLFTRLMASYGRDFLARYEGQDPNAIKSSWAHELAGYANNLGPIAFALENLPERAPNVFEFRSICRRSPLPDVPRLSAPKLDLERVAAELSKLGALKADMSQKPLPGRLEWAHRLKAKDEHDPKSVTQTVRAMYRDALKEAA